MSNHKPILISPTHNFGGNQNFLTGSTFIVQPAQAEFGPKPQIAYCLNCEKKQVTTIERVNGNRANIAALLLCMVGCWGCCCFPYFMKSMKNTMHYCSICGQFMGIYNT